MSNRTVERSVCYTVVVGNIGHVHCGASRAEAVKVYNEYCEESQSGKGRAGGEDVTLMADDMPILEYYGSIGLESEEL